MIAAGSVLDVDEREAAAPAVQRFVDDEQAAIDAAWIEEINRRIGDAESRSMETLGREETHRMIRAGLAA